MSLADALNSAARLFPGPECGVRILRRRLEGKDLQAFDAALGDPDWRGSDLSRALNEQGYRLGAQSITRHRARECSCDRRDT